MSCSPREAFLAIHSVSRSRGRLRACALLAALLASCLAITPLTNRLLTGEFHYSKGGHHFLMARMLQWGVMQRYLEDGCPRITSPFCEYRELLSTQVGGNYLWDTRSPLKALGGRSAGRNATQTAILGAAAAFPGMTVARAGADALRQLARVRTGEGTYPYAPSMTVVEQIGKRFPSEVSSFSASAQQRGTLAPVSRAVSRMHLGAMVIALGILLGSAKTRNFRLAVTLGLMVVNAVVCGVLSKPDDRYGSRVAWIPVFLAIAQLAESRRPGSAGERGSRS